MLIWRQYFLGVYSKASVTGGYDKRYLYTYIELPWPAGPLAGWIWTDGWMTFLHISAFLDGVLFEALPKYRADDGAFIR